jgi:hypothetical protein
VLSRGVPRLRRFEGLTGNRWWPAWDSGEKLNAETIRHGQLTPAGFWRRR